VLFCAKAVDAQELVSGHVIGRHIFGLATDVSGDPLLIDDIPLIYGASYFDQTLSFDDNAFVVSGFGDTLGGLYITRYDVKSKRYVDTVSFSLAAVEGLSRPRGGIITPWNTVLFGEALLVDGANPQGFIDGFKAFYKGKAELVNPYHNGWITEAIILDEQGSGKIKIIKNYAVGRVFASQLFMMPDNKTLYLFDRDNAGLMYLYIAEKANSLTKGTLFGISLDNGKLVYDLLGRSSALKVKFKLKKLDFDKLFEVAPVDGGDCPEKFVHVNNYYGEECLQVKKKNRKYAGLFDPIRMLSIKRKGRRLTKFAKVVFGQKRSGVELTGEGGLSMTYGLGSGAGLEQGKDLDSQYIIQEVQR
jgi:hypothetical protein